MVVELSWVQVEDVENPHSGSTTASTTNSTFNYGRDIARPAVEEAYQTNGIRILNHTALASGIHLLIDYYHSDWQNEDLSMPGDGKVADLLFSSQDPDKTGRPVRLVFGSTPKDGDALHIRELGGFAVKKPKIQQGISEWPRL